MQLKCRPLSDDASPANVGRKFRDGFVVREALLDGEQDKSRDGDDEIGRASHKLFRSLSGIDYEISRKDAKPQSDVEKVGDRRKLSGQLVRISRLPAHRCEWLVQNGRCLKSGQALPDGV